MQEYKNDELVDTQMLKGDGVVPKMRKDSTHQVIGKIPPKGSTITMNGLSFTITSCDNIKGRFVAMIKRPKR